MKALEGYFYFVDNLFFETVNEPNLKQNYEQSKRPHYFAMRDEKTSLLWLVPCSTKVEKFEGIIEKRKKYNRPNDTIKIVTVQDKKSVLLLQDMFPITDKYIVAQYIRGGQPVKIADTDMVAEIERAARRVIILLRRGTKFTPTQPDINRIEKMMIDELNNEQ